MGVSVKLCWCVWMRLAFESVDRVKQIVPLNVTGIHPIS